MTGKNLKKALSSKFKKEDYFNYGRWVQPTLSGTFWCHWGSAKSVKKIFGQKFDPMLFLDGHSLTTIDDLKKFKTIISRPTKDRVQSLIKKIERVGAQVEKDHLEVLKRKNLNYSQYLPKLFSTYQEVVGVWWLVLQLGDEIERYMAENNLPVDGLQQYIEAKTQKTWLQIEVDELRMLAKKINNPTPSNKLIQRHVAKFKWLGTHHWMGEGLTVKECIKHIKRLRSGPQIRTNNSKMRASHPIWDLLVALTYWRTHCAELTAKVVYESRPKLEEFGRRFTLSYDQLIYLSHREILKAISKNKLVLPVNFQQRKQAYGCYLKGGKEVIVVGGTFNRLVRELVVDSANVRASVVKGVPVSAGPKISGRAKVIIAPRDFKKFKRGDILIAPETTPDFVPLMKMAKAVVTERGGVTSHAAIVSRELGVPCVVRAEGATIIFKDSDLVEVDANKGIVKKLQSSSKKG